MRYSIEPRKRRHVKGYGFYHLLEILVHMHLKLLKTRVINMVRNLLTALKNLQQMLQRLLQKEQFKKQLKQPEI